MKNSLFVSLIFFLFFNISFAQNSNSLITTEQQKIKETIYKVEKMQGEIFQEELLIEVVDLGNVGAKVKETFISFVSTSDFFTYHGSCDRLNIVKIKVNKEYFKNYNDVKAKIEDKNISKGIRLLSGTFADLDTFCN